MHEFKIKVLGMSGDELDRVSSVQEIWTAGVQALKHERFILNEVVELKQPVLEYTIRIDGVESKVSAQSLAEVASKVRCRCKRIQVWSPVSVLLIDTQYGDDYKLVLR